MRNLSRSSSDTSGAEAVISKNYYNRIKKNAVKDITSLASSLGRKNEANSTLKDLQNISHLLIKANKLRKD